MAPYDFYFADPCNKDSNQNQRDRQSIAIQILFDFGRKRRWKRLSNKLDFQVVCFWFFFGFIKMLLANRIIVPFIWLAGRQILYCLSNKSLPCEEILYFLATNLSSPPVPLRSLWNQFSQRNLLEQRAKNFF